MSDNILFKIENLQFYWDKDNILFENSNFTIKNNTFTTIIGKNGSGKTTLIKILSNLVKPKKGRIFLNGKETNKYKLKELAQIISYVEQDFDKNIPLKVIDILKLGVYPYLSIFYKNNYFKDRIEKAIHLCKIENLLQKEYNQLSCGEKQKVMIARALCQSDSLILLDEPTSFLDIKNEKETMNLLKDLVNNNYYTIIMITHNINLCYQYSDSIITIANKNIEIHNKEDFLQSSILKSVYDVEIEKIKLDEKIIFYY